MQKRKAISAIFKVVQQTRRRINKNNKRNKMRNHCFFHPMLYKYVSFREISKKKKRGEGGGDKVRSHMADKNKNSRKILKRKSFVEPVFIFRYIFILRCISTQPTQHTTFIILLPVLLITYPV